MGGAALCRGTSRGMSQVLLPEAALAGEPQRQQRLRALERKGVAQDLLGWSPGINVEYPLAVPAPFHFRVHCCKRLEGEPIAFT